jgi:hypothetical protein
MNIDKVVKSFEIHPNHHPHTFFALDLGQSQDPSVLMAVTRHWIRTGEYDFAYRCHIHRLRLTVEDIHRWPLRVYYHQVVEQTCEFIREYSRKPFLLGQPHNHMTLIVDASGVGAPIAEMLEQAQLPCTFNRVIITSGDQESYTKGAYHVPRRTLLGHLRLALEKDLIRVPKGIDGADQLKTELTNLVIGRQTAHDDLAVALAMACYRASSMNFGPPNPPYVQNQWAPMPNFEDMI